MTSTVERLPNLGKYERYLVAIGNIHGEVFCLSGLAEQSVDELLGELVRHANRQ